MKSALPEEQIEALLSGRAFDLAKRVLGRVETTDDYCRVFTVTTADVLAFVDAHGLPHDVYHHGPSSWDGWYCHEDEDGWWVYWQERASRFDETGPLSSRAEAHRVLAQRLLDASGTGIDFDREPDDPARGSGGASLLKFSRPRAGGPSVQGGTDSVLSKAGTRPKLSARASGLAIVVAGYLAMIVMLQLGVSFGTPEATGSAYSNLGILMLLGLPWVVLVAGGLQMVLGLPLRALPHAFDGRSPCWRGLAALSAILFSIAMTAAAVLARGFLWPV